MNYENLEIYVGVWKRKEEKYFDDSDFCLIRLLLWWCFYRGKGIKEKEFIFVRILCLILEWLVLDSKERISRDGRFWDLRVKMSLLVGMSGLKIDVWSINWEEKVIVKEIVKDLDRGD